MKERIHLDDRELGVTISTEAEGEIQGGRKFWGRASWGAQLDDSGKPSFKVHSISLHLGSGNDTYFSPKELRRAAPLLLVLAQAVEEGPKYWVKKHQEKQQAEADARQREADARAQTEDQ